MFHYFHSGEVQRTAVDTSSSDNICKYDCDLCDSGDWLSETEVELHKKSMHSGRLFQIVNKRANACLTCVKTFPDKKSLIGHIKFAHLYSSKSARRIEREIFICQHCYQIFFNKQLLGAHIVHRHMKKDNMKSIVLKCPLCNKYKHAEGLYKHLTNHQMQSVSICQICLLKQRNTKSLVQHMETHLKYYHCNICGYMATKDKGFNMHLDAYERKKSRFEVKNYKEYFLHPQKRHKWTYNPLRVGLQGLAMFNEIYICILCRQICTSHNGMQKHILRDHSSEPETVKPEKKVCLCGEEFSNMIMLKHHVFKTEGQHGLLGAVNVNIIKDESSDEESSSCIEVVDSEIYPQSEITLSG